MKLIITTLFLTLYSFATFAQCPCTKISVEEALEKHQDIAFVELISKSRNSETFGENQFTPGGFVNVFKVWENVKGSKMRGDTISCLTGNGVDDDGYIFEFGKPYVLFHEKYIDKCSPTLIPNFANTQAIYKYKSANTKKDHEDFMAPPPPPMMVNWTSELYKHQTEDSFIKNGMEAEIINENKEQILKELNSTYNVRGTIYVSIGKNNKIIIAQRSVKNGPKEIYFDDSLFQFIHENMKFGTKGKECFYPGSVWTHTFE